MIKQIIKSTTPNIYKVFVKCEGMYKALNKN